MMRNRTQPLGVLEGPVGDFAALPRALRGLAAGAGIEALYVHVPFCTTKCHYCDFYSVAGHLEQADAYLEALAREIRLSVEHLGKPRPRTAFIGGGTPTLLAPAELERLLGLVVGSIDASGVEEFTIEANPNTFDAERAGVLRRLGVNRISFGAQSFVPAELRMLQRDHDPENVLQAVEIARRAGLDNLNLDLIFGIPGQTAASWEYSLGRALELRPTHMSCYNLTYEPNTAMTARLKRGEIAALDEETELALFEHVYRRLRDAGFVRYEISNYARLIDAVPAVCRHNICYWKGGNWLGWGPSAGTHLALHAGADWTAWRWKNVSSLNHYLGSLTGAHPALPLTQAEQPSAAEWAAEIAVFWLRLAEGIKYGAFRERTGVDVRPALERSLAKYAELGLVELTSEGARIVEAGVAVSNRILGDVLRALSASKPPGKAGG